MAKLGVPTHLKHKPIFVLDDDYKSIDGNYKNDSDVVGLSLGKAQWTDKNEFVPSVKVWRRKKWSLVKTKRRNNFDKGAWFGYNGYQNCWFVGK